MRLTKSLLCAISALVLAIGTAFAGQDSTMESSVENSSPELLGGPEMMANDRPEMMASESLEEIDVIYVYPVEVTEYYLIVPSQSSEMPG